MEGLLKKILMDFNALELNELDDDRLDSDVRAFLFMINLLFSTSQ